MDHAQTSPGAALAPSDVVRSSNLSTLGGARHGFFGRPGGVSTGLYAGLNVGTGSEDDPGHVAENRARASAFLGAPADRLATPWQVHSAEAVVVEAPFSGERPKADAVVTRVPGLVVGVLTADCGPILFHDPENRVVGAAHAGWRGALGGVLEATLDAMERIGTRRGAVRAVLGPTITQANYEVGADMADQFPQADRQRFFSAGAAPGKAQFDLPGFILSRLSAAGVGSAAFVGRCTYGEPERFFSFRRTTLRGEPDYGRQLSAIVLDL
ncbi:peptidoglycan editing factor PgeF [Antarcticirhabdus aurantiaca]|uniref:Peptidoglycan editing factor PgeF n=1 Tax=Antarcticirhabdus aurantiaca TaxID=2606717 RepID=A0ACD4NTA4_9HYPH|nr:peptidoglycan editing factor PgeF [Antarcticirhabdus aurantiaca]WAJ30075.1 peptidoglycan editing factor PgeF [Jeongeuplla avenae]